MKTLLIIKPGFARRRPVYQETVRILESNHLEVEAWRRHAMTKDEAEQFYAVHKGKDFYDRLIQYMTSGLSIMLVVTSKNPKLDVVSKVRDIVGKTNPEEAAEGTLRHTYGKDTTRNGFHSSDSPEAAVAEIAMFFD